MDMNPPASQILSISKEGMLGVLEQLHGSPDLETGSAMHLDLSGIRFLKPVHQAALSAWALAWRQLFPHGKLEVTSPEGEAGSFAFHCGLMATINGHEINNTWANGIPLRQLHNAIEADKAAEDIGTLISGEVGANLVAELIELFGEMLDNAVRHGEADPVGVVAAQALPNLHQVDLALVDTGIGIRESFLVNGANQGRPIVEEGRSPLLFATEPQATSKPDKHTGLGLFLALETVRMNQGSAVLLSGKQALQLEDGRLSIRSIPFPWKGTCLSLSLNTDRAIPMDQANELIGDPPLDRYRSCTLDLAIYGLDLVTRSRGLAVRKDLAVLAKRGPVTVDATKVRAIGPSFLDEAFARPQLDAEDPPLVKDLRFEGIDQVKLARIRKLRDSSA